MAASVRLVVLSALLISVFCRVNSTEIEEEAASDNYLIEGKVFPPDPYISDGWQASTKVLVNGGEFMGFVREDGSFTVSNVPSGSYVVEVSNPNYAYEPVRLEINSKGKFRARKVNHIQTSLVNQLPYPMKLKPIAGYRYFQVREQWRVTDFLFSPMVLMMVLPLLLIMVLPKMLNDPETKKEMDQLSNFKYDMPEMSEFLTSYFTGADKTKPKAVKGTKNKRQ